MERTKPYRHDFMNDSFSRPGIVLWGRINYPLDAIILLAVRCA